MCRPSRFRYGIGFKLNLGVAVLSLAISSLIIVFYYFEFVQLMGMVSLNISVNEVLEREAFLRRMAIVTILLAVVAAVFFGTRLTGRLLTPIHQLQRGFRQLAEGKDDFIVPIQSQDEFGELAVSFNIMGNQLKEAQKSLRAWNNRLRLSVEERTDELKKAKAQLEIAYNEEKSSVEQLRDLDRLISSFLNNMSHELRAPLDSILSSSKRLMESGAGPMTDEQKDYVANIYSNSQHLLLLINSIFDLARIQAGKMSLNLSFVKASRLVEGIKPIITVLARHKKQELIINAADDLPDLWIDELKIKQVLLNLLGNAIKYTDEGGKISLEISEAPPEGIRFCVSDTGCGIKAEDLDMIFGEFQQADVSALRMHEGAGLGLTICKKLVELHGGEIGVTSAHGQGSTFFFELPLQLTAVPEMDADAV